MRLGRVIGTCVASRKSDGLDGVRLLLVEPLDSARRPTGDPFVAADTVSAGPNELVYWVGAREAALALETHFVPIDAAIVGIIDEIDAAGPRARAFVRGRDDVPGGGAHGAR